MLRDGTVAHVRPITPDDADGDPPTSTPASPTESIYLRFFAPLRELQRPGRLPVHRTSTTTTGSPSSRPSAARSSASVATTASTAGSRRGRLQHLATTTRARASARSCSSTWPAIAQETGHQPVRRRGAAAEPQDAHGLRARPATRSPTTSRTVSSRCPSTSRRPSSSQGGPAARASTVPRRSACARSSSPSAVAVIGASRREESIGAPHAAQHPRRRASPGAVYAVNREAQRDPGLPGLPARPRRARARSTSPSSPSRRRRSSTSSRTARKAGVKALLVVSAGFAEAGEEGADCRTSCVAGRAVPGMRVVGPNSLRRHQQRPRRAAQRLAGPGHAADRAARPLRAERRPRRRGARVGRATRPGHLDLRLGRQPCRRLRQRPHAVLDRRPRAPTPSASTWSRWATRASSRGSPGALARDQARHRREVGRLDASASRPVTAPASPTCPPQAFDAMLRQAGVIRVENVHQLFDVAQLIAAPAAAQGRPGRHRRQLRRARGAQRRAPASAGA